MKIGAPLAKIKEEYPEIYDPKFGYQFMVTDGSAIYFQRSVDTLEIIADESKPACVFVLNIATARAEPAQSRTLS